MINQEAPALAAPVRVRRSPFANSRKELGIFALLVVLCVFTGLRNHNFFSANNLEDLARLVGIYGIFGIGMGIVIITGGIDLSVGSVFAVEGVLASILLVDHHAAPVVAVVLCMALTMGFGLLHGVLITRVPLQPFIVTLCALMSYRGLARFMANDETKGFGDSTGFQGLTTLMTGNVLGVPNAFVALLVIAVIMWVVLHRSVYGRYLYAVGRNEEAARYSGIASRNVIASAYVVSGALAGVAGLLLAFYTNSMSPSTHGQSYELYGIAAAVLGGCSLRGGEGSIIGILIGTALLQVLQNLVNLLGIPSSLNLAVIGVVILLGVITDEVVKRRSLKRVKV